MVTRGEDITGSPEVIEQATGLRDHGRPDAAIGSVGRSGHGAAAIAVIRPDRLIHVAGSPRHELRFSASRWHRSQRAAYRRGRAGAASCAPLDAAAGGC